MVDFLVLTAVLASGYAAVAFAAGMLTDCVIAGGVWGVAVGAATILIRRARAVRP